MWASEKEKKNKGDGEKKTTNARARNESNAFSNSVLSFGFLEIHGS